MISATIRLEAGRLDPAAELARFLAQVEGHGALVSFVGLTRPATTDGASVSGLYLDHYPGMTEQSLHAIAATVMARHAKVAIHIVHRVGDVGASEPIVFAAAASDHRAAAFEAASEVMDRLKSEAMFWKREDRADGAVWIEPTAADGAALDRWQSGKPSAD